MDRLQTSLIGFLLLTGHSYLATLLYGALLLAGIAPTHYVTLSSFCGVMTYAFYGVFGLLYSALSFVLISTSCAMYWYDVTLEDVSNKVLEQASATDTLGAAEVGEGTDEPPNTRRPVNRNTIYEDLTQFIESNTNITQDDINNWYDQFANYYGRASGYYDGFANFAISIMNMFYAATTGLPVFKDVYGYIAHYWTSITRLFYVIDGIKRVSKISRDLDNQLSSGARTVGDANSVDSVDEDLDDSVIPTRSAAPSSSGPAFPGLSPMGMDFEQMQKFEQSLTPQQRREMSEAAMKMMGNIDMTQMAGMMEAFGQMSGQVPPQGQNKKTD